MSQFDPASFLDATTTEVNEKRTLLPVDNPEDSNGLYTALCGEPTPKSGEKDGRPWLQVAIPLKLQVPASLQVGGIGRELTVTHRVFIDLTPEGNIDNSKGRNNQQRMFREALDMNKPGEAFSWRMVAGRPVKVKIKHNQYNGNWSEDVAQVVKA